MNVDLHELTKFCQKRGVDLNPAQGLTLLYVMGDCEANGVGLYDWEEFEYSTHRFLNKTDYESVIARLQQTKNIGFFKQYCKTYYQLPLYVEWNKGLRRKANSEKAPYPPWVRYIPDQSNPSQGSHKVNKELFEELFTYPHLISTPNCKELSEITALLEHLTKNSRELTGTPSSSSSLLLSTSKAFKDLSIKESFKEEESQSLPGLDSETLDKFRRWLYEYVKTLDYEIKGTANAYVNAWIEDYRYTPGSGGQKECHQFIDDAYSKFMKIRHDKEH